jgi:hypothetical protein
MAWSRTAVQAITETILHAGRAEMFSVSVK